MNKPTKDSGPDRGARVHPAAPAPCPECGERQNVSPGAFDPDDAGFLVGCMVCGRRFTPAEYKAALAVVLKEPPKGLARRAARNATA